ncbi:MAG TPA: Smr/MutS family protein [Terriglobales bacterium]|jgi:dsDNA-specific endonuclease/ATPase MutS2|nr:Smr/MutS family protein [Terriglobales bacterium]
MAKADQTQGFASLAVAAEAPFQEPVVLPLQDSLDLHPFQPKDIPSVVEEYLRQCQLEKFTQVRLIHGKGIGVQRNIVRSVLSKQSTVLSFGDAPPEAGGWGATVVILKQPA